jgi:cysteine-S-conjugate beta-lyase
VSFDESVDRRKFPTLKWSGDFLEKHFGNPDALPMSVADMDFKSPPAVTEKLGERVAHGIFGYEFKPNSYFGALESWYRNRHDWVIEQDQIEPCPSILNAIAVLLNQHSGEGEGVIVQSPYFFEFRKVIRSSKRKVVTNPLNLVGGRYHLDFDDLEKKAADPKNKILVLCNPHNPVGRVWTTAELDRLVDISIRHDLFVISDEIHGDFAFKPHLYRPYLSVSETAAQNAAACISPAKTFNIAGMTDALAVIPGKEHRDRFRGFTDRYQVNKTNVFSTLAVETAYREGKEWLDGLQAYLKGNVDLIRGFLAENEMGVSLIEPEGTFLAWLDFRGLGFNPRELHKFLAKEAGLALSPGHWFGREGAGFGRMTIGCPRSRVEQALTNLAGAVLVSGE